MFWQWFVHWQYCFSIWLQSSLRKRIATSLANSNVIVQITDRTLYLISLIIKKCRGDSPLRLHHYQALQVRVIVRRLITNWVFNGILLFLQFHDNVFWSGQVVLNWGDLVIVSGQHCYHINNQDNRIPILLCRCKGNFRLLSAGSPMPGYCPPTVCKDLHSWTVSCLCFYEIKTLPYQNRWNY